MTGTSHPKHEPAPPSEADAPRQRRGPPGRRRTESGDRTTSHSPAAPRPSRAQAGAPSAKSHRPADEALLVREVKAAIADLKAGNSVAAYERLRRAVE